MQKSLPVISVIIPTHQGSQAWPGTLRSLLRQTYPAERFEVILVTGANAARIQQEVGRLEPQFPVRVLEQPGPGPSVRRNIGAQNARGDLLMFLDDDILLEPQVIQAHVEIHRETLNAVVIGYFPPVATSRQDFLQVASRDWWETCFREMGAPGHRFSYQDLLTGNCSLPAALFAQSGGFDTRFNARDDSELGLRLLRAGANYVFAKQARGLHQDLASLMRSFGRKYEEGKVDVLLGRQHPELIPTLLLQYLVEHATLPGRLLRACLFRWPALANLLVACLRPLLPVLQALRLRGPWRGLLYRLQYYHYWRGVKEQLATWEQVREFLASGASAHAAPLEVDLAGGLAEAERAVDARRPESLVICYGGLLVGEIPAKPGAERLRGAHLRAALADAFALPLAKAMALKRVSEKMAAGRSDAPALDAQPFAGTGAPGYSHQLAERREWLLGQVAALNAEFSAEQEPYELLEHTLQRVSELFAPDSGSILLCRGREYRAEGMLLHAGKTFAAAPEGLEDVLQKGFAGWVISSGQAGWIQNTREDHRWLARTWEKEAEVSRSVIGIPFVLSEDEAGILTVSKKAPRAFSAHDVELLQAFVFPLVQALRLRRLVSMPAVPAG